jgi:3-phenylpropionate/trans-cinnamate dioxygenase ferredoxin subunit
LRYAFGVILIAVPLRPVARGGGNERNDAVAEAKITVRNNGPYLVTGLTELRDADGNAYPVKETMALCRCGGSTTKPFCDGTHSRAGFQAAERAVAQAVAEGH